MEHATDPIANVVEYGRQIDFGKTASDYGRHRAGYPDELYRRLIAMRIGIDGQRILDIATGTGFLGRGFARAGCAVTALDISMPLMLEARRLDGDAGVAMTYVRARAEAIPFADSRFDVVCAGQSWHWFERARAASELRRVLHPGGLLVLAHFDWIPLPGNVVEATEQMIMKHNSKWALGGGLGLHPTYLTDLAIAGFTDLESFSFDVMAPYTHEGWRGRIRASAGVGGSLKPAEVQAFDAEFAALLARRFPQDPLGVHHRTFAVIARAPA